MISDAGRESCHADGDFHLDFPTLNFDRGLFDGLAQTLHGQGGAFRSCAGEDDEEFIATDAEDVVLITHHTEEGVGNVANDRIAGDVAGGVVDMFETIDVDNSAAEQIVGPSRAGYLSAKAVVGLATVEQAGEPVARGLNRQSLIHHFETKI